VTQDERLGRLEGKIDRLQEQTHEYQLEVLSVLKKDKEDTNQELTEMKLKIKEHDGHFATVIKVLGLGSLVSGWIALKDLWPNK
jgi:hypothetical protein